MPDKQFKLAFFFFNSTALVTVHCQVKLEPRIVPPVKLHWIAIKVGFYFDANVGAFATIVSSLL